MKIDMLTEALTLLRKRLPQVTPVVNLHISDVEVNNLFYDGTYLILTDTSNQAKVKEYYPKAEVCGLSYDEFEEALKDTWHANYATNKTKDSFPYTQDAMKYVYGLCKANGETDFGMLGPNLETFCNLVFYYWEQYKDKDAYRERWDEEFEADENHMEMPDGTLLCFIG